MTEARDGEVAQTIADSEGTHGPRKQRILDATLDLAEGGGYEAVQMRVIAERSNVSLGTLYRYFPSKIHLLIALMHREMHVSLLQPPLPDIPGDSAAERMRSLVAFILEGIQRRPRLTEALTRALTFADATVKDECEAVLCAMDRVVARALTKDDPTDRQLAIGRVFTDVWLANIVALVTQRATTQEVTMRLELAAGLIIGDLR
jgi:TetR/AcrR family transcriptional regulator, cholesterol catabolism regulator